MFGNISVDKFKPNYNPQKSIPITSLKLGDVLCCNQEDNSKWYAVYVANKTKHHDYYPEKECCVVGKRSLEAKIAAIPLSDFFGSGAVNLCYRPAILAELYANEAAPWIEEDQLFAGLSSGEFVERLRRLIDPVAIILR